MNTLMSTINTKRGASRLIVFVILTALLISIIAPIVSTETYASSPDIKIRYLDIDGKVLKEGIVSSGAILDPPSNPVKSGMTFLGWDKELGDHTTDTDINAVYELNMTTDKEQKGQLGSTGTATPPEEPTTVVIASSTEGSVTVDTSEEAITTPEIIKTPPVPEAAPEEGLSTSTIVLSILAAIVALALVGYIFFIIRRRKKNTAA